MIAEIRAARGYVAEPFFELADDNTFLDRRWAEDFLRAVTPEGIRYFTETDVSVADDPALCDRLAASGCRQLLIGFESPRADDLAGLDPAEWKRRRAPHLRRVVDTLQSRGRERQRLLHPRARRPHPGRLRRGPRLRARVRARRGAVHRADAVPRHAAPRAAPPRGPAPRERFWDRCTLFDVTFTPKRMTVAELEAGLRWLFEETYTRRETEARLQSFVAQRRDARLAARRGAGAPWRPDAG